MLSIANVGSSCFNFTWEPFAHLFIFAYQVKGLASGEYFGVVYCSNCTIGLYVLVRNATELDNLKRVTQKENFAWTIPEGISLPLCIQPDLYDLIRRAFDLEQTY